MLERMDTSVKMEGLLGFMWKCIGNRQVQKILGVLMWDGKYVEVLL